MTLTKQNSPSITSGSKKAIVDKKDGERISSRSITTCSTKAITAKKVRENMQGM